MQTDKTDTDTCLHLSPATIICIVYEHCLQQTSTSHSWRTVLTRHNVCELS